MQRKENLKTSSCVSQYTLSNAVYLPLDTLKNNQLDHTALHNIMYYAVPNETSHTFA